MTETALAAFKKLGTLTGVDAESNPLPVTLTGDSVTITVGPEPASAPTDRSGTITLGGTAQQAMAANTARNEAFVYNVDPTETMWINFVGGTATANTQGSVEIPSRTGWAGKVTSAVSIVAATTGHKFTAGER